MDEFSQLFSPKKSGQTAPEEDAKATFVDDASTQTAVEIQEEVKPPVQVEPKVEEPVTTTAQTQEPVDGEYWKKKYEAAEKQRRDLQAYTDKRFNDLERKLGDVKSTPQAPVQQEKELSEEELNDLFLDNPAKAARYLLDKEKAQNKPAIDQSDIDFRVQEGVMRAMHDDYDDVVGRVTELVSFKPELLTQIQQASNPAKAAYELGKQMQKSLEQPDLEQIKAQLRKELEEEYKQKNQSQRSLRTVPSTAPTTGSTKRVNKDSFSALFGGKRAAL